jgi:hypothetical protein
MIANSEIKRNNHNAFINSSLGYLKLFHVSVTRLGLGQLFAKTLRSKEFAL